MRFAMSFLRRPLCSRLNVMKVVILGCVCVRLTTVELKQRTSLAEEYRQNRSAVPDMTMTTDTSFVERPAARPARTPSQRGGKGGGTQRGQGRGTTTSRGRGYGR